MVTPLTLDSLIGSEFQVELNGVTLTGIFNITHLVTLQFDDSGTRVLPPFEIGKMVQRDPNAPLNQWLVESADARQGATRPTRTLTIKAVDDGVVTRTWTVKGAYLRGVRYSDFDVSSFKMVEEIFTIGYEDITETFSA